MIQVSVCMIVKNEEAVLARSLACVRQFADEIIIVDTGSSDKTKEIAYTYTDQVYDFIWCDDFSKARNVAFSKATKEYCMWLDADDIILDEDIEKLKQLKSTIDTNMDMVLMKYHTGFDEQGSPTFSYYRERWIKNHKGYVWEGFLHEVIALHGNIQYVDIAITHRKVHVADPDRNLRIFKSRIHKGIQLNPREQFYYARELYYHARYKDAYKAFEQFLDSKEGWIENNIDACEMMGYCAYHIEDKQPLVNFYQSFLYDTPRAELCCDIGKHFFDQERYQQAIFWYEVALHTKRNDTSGAFVRGDCYGYLPALQLCVCWWRLGHVEVAEEYNEKAGEYKVTSKEVIANRLYFEKEKALR